MRWQEMGIFQAWTDRATKTDIDISKEQGTYEVIKLNYIIKGYYLLASFSHMCTPTTKNSGPSLWHSFREFFMSISCFFCFR